MDLNTAIRLRALKVVLRPDRDYFVRTVLRWYSKTFFTPLAQVEELPLEDVFQAYYEERYANMSEDDLERERAELLTTEEERYARIVAEEIEEAESFETRRIIQAEETAKKLEADKRKAAGIAETPQKLGPIRPRDLPEADLPRESALPKNLPPAITMSFVDDAEFEAELDGFGAMGQPDNKKP